MDNLLSYIEMSNYSIHLTCLCNETDYLCFRRDDFIKCCNKKTLLELCPYLNILIDPKIKYNLIEKPEKYSSCDNSTQYYKIIKFLLFLISKQDIYFEMSKIIGVMCIFYIVLTNINYNIIPKTVFYEKLDLVITNQEEHITNPFSNKYKITNNFNKSSVADFIETINNWKKYI